MIGSFWAAMAVAIVLVGSRLAEPLLGLVYGDSSAGAASSLRLLLPGAVLFAGVLDHRRRRIRRRAAASPPPASAARDGVTVIGLFVFVPDGGVTAAAMVSSVSYAVGVRRHGRGLPPDHRHSRPRAGAHAGASA